MSDVAVVGAGYVGLTTAACFARLGHDVRCADIDAERVARLSKGEIPILEEGLPGLVAEGLAIQRLRFVVGAADAVRGAEFVFLCVGTPQGDDGSADLSALEAVAREIAPLLQPDAVVVNKSTVPVGTTRLVARWLADRGVARLVLVSRRGGTAPGATELHDELTASGIEVDLVAVVLVDPFDLGRPVHLAAVVAGEVEADTGRDRPFEGSAGGRRR